MAHKYCLILRIVTRFSNIQSNTKLIYFIRQIINTFCIFYLSILVALLFLSQRDGEKIGRERNRYFVNQYLVYLYLIALDFPTSDNPVSEIQYRVIRCRVPNIEQYRLRFFWKTAIASALLLLWVCYAIECHFGGDRHKSLSPAETHPQNRL